MMRRGISVCFCWLVLVPLLMAQANLGTVRGTVTDASGAVVPGADISLANEKTGEQRMATSNSAGNYEFPLVEQGFYMLRAQLAGFKTAVITGFEMRVGIVARADFTLQVGDVATQVEVIEEMVGAPLVRTDSGTRDRIVPGELLRNLPNATRDWTLALTTAPGYNSDDGLNGVKTYAGFSVHLNGADVSDLGTGRALGAVPIPIEAVEQVKINTNAGDAESGFGAVQITVASKRGTNEFHGSMYEFYKGTFGAARNAFDAPSTRLSRFNNNQFGFTLGGPVMIPKVYNGRNKTFFFVAFDDSIRKGAANPRRATALRGTSPTEKMRNGDFSEVSFKLRDPLSGSTIATQSFFPGNIIPASRITPLSKNLWATYASLLPNGPGLSNNLVVNPPPENIAQNSKLLTLRFDQQIGSKDTVSVTLNDWLGWTNANQLNVWSTGPVVGSEQTPFWNLAGQWVHIISPHLLSETSLLWRKVTFRSINRGSTASRLFFKETGMQPPPGLVENPDDPRTLGGPMFNFSGQGAMTRFGVYSLRPTSANTETFYFAERLSYIAGSHTLKAGLEITKPNNMQPEDIAQQRGEFGFVGDRNSPLSTGWAMADFLLGLPANSTYRSLGGVELRTIHKSRYGAYLQDNWKVSPRLTLNYGLRWEYTAPVTEDQNRLAMFDLETKQIVVAGNTVPQVLGKSYAGIPIVPGTSVGLDRSLWRTSKKYFTPRLGVAFRPWGGTKSVIRAGYGMYFQDIGVFNQSGAANSPPFVYTVTARTQPGEGRITWSNSFPAVSAEPTNFLGWARFWPTQRFQQWNLTVEQEIGWKTAISVGYVGTRIDDSPIQVDANYPLAASRNPNGTFVFQRPFTGVNNITYQTWEGYARNHSLQVEVKRNFVQGLMFDNFFVWGKQIDNGLYDGGYSGPTKYLSTYRGISTGTRKFSFLSEFLWDIPVGRARAYMKNMNRIFDAAVGGWTLSGILNAQTGPYFNPTFSNTLSSFGVAGSRPDEVPGVSWKDAPPGLWFNPAAFAVPAPPTGDEIKFGTAGRNIISGPGLFNLDLTISKFFRIYDSHRFELRAETYNALNHVNLRQPEANISDPSSVGKIFQAFAARTWQFALRYEF